MILGAKSEIKRFEVAVRVRQIGTVEGEQNGVDGPGCFVKDLLFDLTDRGSISDFAFQATIVQLDP